jgi:hypothetical protein
MWHFFLLSSVFDFYRQPGLPDFSWSEHTKTGKNIPNDLKLCQKAVTYVYKMAEPYSKWSKNIKHFLFQGTPNFPKFGIFVSKTNHLATLQATSATKPVLKSTCERRCATVSKFEMSKVKMSKSNISEVKKCPKNYEHFKDKMSKSNTYIGSQQNVQK